MQKSKCIKEYKNKGITLIALVLTIIILLILSGISISNLNGSGLFQKSEEATRISEIKQIEEYARILYMEGQMEEILGGEAITIAGVINGLKEKKYIIKRQITEEDAIIGIFVKNKECIMEKESTEIITYEIVYDEGKVRYFVEVQGKDYEILFNNGEITVNTEESNIDETEIVRNEVTVETKDANIVKATIKENTEDILLESGTTGGIVEVTITEKNSNVTKTFNVVVKEPATSLTVTPTEVTIMRESTTKLTATLEPSNTTDKVVWNSSDEAIAKVSEDGTVTGMAIGTAIITAKCGEFTQNCTITVEPKKLVFEDLVSERVRT